MNAVRHCFVVCLFFILESMQTDTPHPFVLIDLWDFLGLFPLCCSIYHHEAIISWETSTNKIIHPSCWIKGASESLYLCLTSWLYCCHFWGLSVAESFNFFTWPKNFVCNLNTTLLFRNSWVFPWIGWMFLSYFVQVEVLRMNIQFEHTLTMLASGPVSFSLHHRGWRAFPKNHMAGVRL